jgi:hypothetical protein
MVNQSDFEWRQVKFSKLAAYAQQRRHEKLNLMSIGLTRDSKTAIGRECSPKPGGQWSGLKPDTHRSGSVTTNCRSNRGGFSRAAVTPHPLARIIKHMTLRLSHRYVESNILCHGGCSLRMLVLQLPSSIRAAPTHSSSARAITSMLVKDAGDIG